MIEKIRIYINLQEEVIQLISENFKGSLEDFESAVIDGWKIESHGDHLYCEFENSTKKIEIPLLSQVNTGIDAGHFDYYLKCIGGVELGYQRMCEELEALERKGNLKQVQINEIPKIWGLA